MIITESPGRYIVLPNMKYRPVEGGAKSNQNKKLIIIFIILLAPSFTCPSHHPFLVPLSIPFLSVYPSINEFIYSECEKTQEKIVENLVNRSLIKLVHIFKPWLLINETEMTVR